MKILTEKLQNKINDLSYNYNKNYSCTKSYRSELFLGEIGWKTDGKIYIRYVLRDNKLEIWVAFDAYFIRGNESSSDSEEICIHAPFKKLIKSIDDINRLNMIDMDYIVHNDMESYYLELKNKAIDEDNESGWYTKSFYCLNTIVKNILSDSIEYLQTIEFN